MKSSLRIPAHRLSHTNDDDRHCSSLNGDGLKQGDRWQRRLRTRRPAATSTPKYVLVGWETCHNIRASFARPPVDCGGASPEVHSPRNRDTAPISAQLRDALAPLSPNVCAHDGTTMTAQAVESDFTEDRECSGARGCLPLPAFHQRDAEDRLMR